MKKIILSALAILALSGTALAGEDKFVNPIVNYDGCTAFYIGDNRFVSAGHCVTSTPTELVTEDKRKMDVEVIVLSDPILGMPDFLVLETKNDYITKHMEALPLNCKYQPKAGDDIKVSGYPKDFGLLTVEGKIAADKVSPWRVWKKSVLRMAVMIINGNSGAPVIRDGQTVGIVVGGDLGGNPNLSVATPISDVCKVLGYGR